MSQHLVANKCTCRVDKPAFENKLGHIKNLHQHKYKEEKGSGDLIRLIEVVRYYGRIIRPQSCKLDPPNPTKLSSEKIKA
jgi:hypothetical protein